MKIAPSTIVAVATASFAITSSSAFIIPQQKTVINQNKAYTTTSRHVSSELSSISTSPLGALNGGKRRKQYTTTSLSATVLSEGKGGVTYNEKCDVLILGSGPAARAIASLLSAPGSDKLDVIMADSNFDKEWPPNYGVWEDEWQSIVDLYKSFGRAIGEECIDRRWGVTDCFFGGSFDIPVDNRFRLDRPYYRIEKNKLRDAVTHVDEEDGYRLIRANHVSRATSINLYSPSGTLTHDEDGSTILLQAKDGTETTVRSKLIVDCTGHETKLVLKDDRVKSDPPGFQIAYGALVEVDESDSPDLTKIGPYDKEAMTLFDYRTDHFPEDSAQLRNAEKAPTFMYAMPLKNNKIFFEETSLVARPAVSFQECKDRCFTRLEHLGIKVTSIEEEEFCYIPMGGPLPAKDQRIVGFGGAAAMVHPSTGYHLCRAMMGAGDVAKTIRSGLNDNAKGKKGVNLDKVAGDAYHAIWSPANIRQRDFAVFGGEFLMKQNVEGLRGFFDGFFRLPLEMWAGFLAGWPGLPNNKSHETWSARIGFGLLFVSKLPLQVAVDMFTSIVAYSVTNFPSLPRSVTPFLPDPEDYIHVERPELMGDVAAKSEAMRMIAESKVTKDVPVAFLNEEEEEKAPVEA
mmetsp:Transcript_8677/g.12785  ORF Transcript_8677/g.12785 Transcript_8677/m.12785 type:complete len:628 (+) Transcript_8677:139-2022(+)